MSFKRILIAFVFAAASACDSQPANPPAAAPANPQAIPAPPDVAAVPADAIRTPSGLAYKILKAGAGTIHPTPTSTVVAHYTGWTTKGEMFDSSVAKGQPLVYPLFKLIPGWVEGMQLMVPGEKCRFWIPGNLAYDGQPGNPQGMLVFDIELLDIQAAR